MGFSPNFPTFFFLFPSIFFWLSRATTFEIINQCSYTVWAVALPGGGRQLNPGETWLLNMADDTVYCRIWGRTNCIFDETGNGSCETGDCNNQLSCQNYGSSPVTVAEYEARYVGVNFYYLSLLDGFNIPMEFKPNNRSCREIKCTADINRECPTVLRTAGGCNHPCTVFKNDFYCCTYGNCTVTDLSNFFMTRCPDAYSFALDYSTKFTCASGSNYGVVFCPLGSSPSLVFPPPPPPHASFAHMCIRIIMI
ncbi:hypothetical protein NE237_001234 [Protea cynaroides]|uniref:Thaumatin-like protein n=1 Tax=Protea cynaroides TaxID=273540 RepID=A0A9Q0KSM7_9MAGN|nr:hypothetical protein NE237_001234 [Protea cynaroides]